MTKKGNVYLMSAINTSLSDYTNVYMQLQSNKVKK